MLYLRPILKNIPEFCEVLCNGNLGHLLKIMDLCINRGAFKGTTISSQCVHLQFSDGAPDFIDACGSMCSNIEAVITAVKTSVQLFDKQAQRRAAKDNSVKNYLV